jgi:hypothetical protein
MSANLEKCTTAENWLFLAVIAPAFLSINQRCRGW